LRERPDVAVVDVGLPGKDGVELTRELKAMADPPGVVVLTMQERPDAVLAAVAAGADAYCVKSSDVSFVVDAVRAVAAGGAYFDPRIAGVVLRRVVSPGAPPERSPLTPRETDVLKLIAEGVGNAEIAERLNLGLGTVKGHVADILEKLRSVGPRARRGDGFSARSHFVTKPQRSIANAMKSATASGTSRSLAATRCHSRSSGVNAVGICCTAPLRNSASTPSRETSE
jgi:DNA-binding NarL/FixJ family response regulator